MKVHVLQHVPFEGLGNIEPWLAARSAEVSWTRFHEAGAVLPAVEAVDFLIVLGGPMSVNDEAALPWLVDEKRFIAAAVARGTPVLGICLGAQLIASAHGARVYPGEHKEIGWFPVTGQPVSDAAFAFPAVLDVFHWHGETFDLPEGAVLLASSVACRHQAYQLGERAVGLQFHVETTPASAQSMLLHCADELVDAPYIQPAAAIASTRADNYAAVEVLMYRLLDWLTR